MDILKRLVCIFLAFALIFAFPILPGVSSAVAVFLYVIMYVVITKEGKLAVNSALYYLKKYPALHVCLIFVSYVLMVIHGSSDTTLLSKTLSSFFLYLASFILFYEIDRQMDVNNVVLWCFTIQSFIIFTAIASEDFYNMTATLRPEVLETHIWAYGRMRGSAICGYQFFGIAAMYSFICAYIIINYSSIPCRNLFLVVNIMAALISGRFAVVGIGAGVFIKVISELRNGETRAFRTFLFVGAFAILFVSLMYKIAENISDSTMSTVVNHYFIEPLNSIIYGSGFESSTTDRMVEMLTQGEIERYFTFGSGRYTNPDGTYFGHIDIGYYRMLGYYGIGGFIVLMWTLVYLIYHTRSNLDIMSKHTLFGVFLLLNFKGDVMVMSNNVVPIVVAWLFFFNNHMRLKDGK